MNWTAELLYSYIENIMNVLSFKSVSRITSQRLSMESAIKYEYEKLKYRQKSNFETDKYIGLADAINNKLTNIETILTVIIGEFVKTGEFPEINLINHINKLKEFTIFYNAIGTKSQMEFLKDFYTKANGSTGKKKFFGEVSLYKQDDSQKNLLYQFVKEGKINVLLYIHCWNLGYFKINKLTIKDKEFLRFIKAIEIIKNVTVEQIK